MQKSLLERILITSSLIILLVVLNVQFQPADSLHDSEITTVYSLGTVTSVFANMYAGPLEDARKTCIDGCNEDYTGNTWIDSTQRSACRSGCDLAYLYEKVKEILDW